MLNRNFYWGMDIREREIWLTTLQLQGKRWKLANAQHQRFETPLFANNLTVNQKELTEGLRQMRNKMRRQARGVHLSVPTQHVFLRRIRHLPDVGENELAQLLRFEIGHSIHLPFDEPFYDFVKLGSLKERPPTGDEATDTPDGQQPAGTTSDLLLVASSKPLLTSLITCCEEAGFPVLSVDLPGLALQRLIQRLHPGWLNGTELVLDIRHDTAELHLFHRGILFLSRPLQLTYVTEDEPMTAQEQGWLETAATDARQDESNRLDLADLAREVERSQTFFQFSILKEDVAFERLIVTGLFSDDTPRLLAEWLSVPVETIRFQPLLRDGLDNRYGNQYSVAIGLGMRGRFRPKR